MPEKPLNSCCTAFVLAVSENKIIANHRKYITNECTVHSIVLTFCPFCGSKLPAAKKRRLPIKKDKSTLFDNQQVLYCGCITVDDKYLTVCESHVRYVPESQRIKENNTMPKTDYNHAGNADQLRNLQLEPDMPRCQFCHYQVGKQKASTEIVLSKITLESGNSYLACQQCLEAFKAGGDAWASRFIRPLPEACQAANNKALELIAMAETARDKAEQASMPAGRVNGHVIGKGTVTITDKDGNTIIIGSTGAIDFKIVKKD